MIDWLIEVSDYSQLSNYTVRLQLCRLIRAKYSSLSTNHIEEIVIVMVIIIKLYIILFIDYLCEKKLLKAYK